MGINPERVKSNEEIEREEMAKEAADKARGFKGVDRRNSNLMEERSEKSVEERGREAQAAIEASNKEDAKRILEKRLAEFDKNASITASKVMENPDATAEDKKGADNALKERNEAAEQAIQKAESAVSRMKMNEDGTWEEKAESVHEEAEERVEGKSSAPEKESDNASSPEENPAGAEKTNPGNEKIPWDQMSQKQREDAVCQAALGALNNIAADQKPSLWERMKAGWSSLKESAKEKWDGAKARLLGEEFAGAREKAKNTWGFLKERLKGVATFGIWEFHQAEKFRAATRDIGKDVNAQARLIEEEEGLSEEDALKEAEAMRAAFEGINRDPSAQEYEMMSRSISAEKMVYNERAIEKIIEDTTKSLEERLEKRSLLQGYRSADVGKKVLTPENIALLQERMRHQLNGMRNGQVRGDFKQYAQLMRRNLDPGWWKRYVYGGVEVALDGLALHLVTAPGAAEAVPGHVPTGGPKVPPPPAELIDPMHRTIWQTTAEFLKAHGIANPTNAQIMEGSKLVAQANHIGVNVWNIPGNLLDIHMQADHLLKMKPLVDNLARIAAM